MQHEVITIQQNELSIFMPMRLKKRGGCKMIFVPEKVSCNKLQENIDQTLVKALVRAHLWQRQMKSGKYKTMQNLCMAINRSTKYVRLICRLNLLSPKIKESILKGQQPRHLKLSDLMRNIPMLWCEQEEVFGLKDFEKLLAVKKF